MSNPVVEYDCSILLVIHRTCSHRHTSELSDSAAALYHVTAAALVARACALLFPNPEGMIHEAGFHSVLYFSIHNTKCQILLLYLTYAFVGRTFLVWGY